MSKVQQATQAPEYVPGKPNAVLGCAPAQIYAVAYTNNEGRKATCLAIVFGKDKDDGGAGVYIMAEQQQMIDTLTIAGNTVRNGVRRELAKGTPVSGGSIPDLTLAPGETIGNGRLDPLKVEVG